jgi:hypothetical protein
MNQTYQTIGMIHTVGDVQLKGQDGTFRIRDFVLVENPADSYPTYAKFKTVQDMTDRLDAFRTGQLVMVSWNLAGRKWTNPDGIDVYFTDLEAAKIDLVEAVVDQDAERGPVTAPVTPAPAPSKEDEVPF